MVHFMVFTLSSDYKPRFTYSMVLILVTSCVNKKRRSLACGFALKTTKNRRPNAYGQVCFWYLASNQQAQHDKLCCYSHRRRRFVVVRNLLENHSSSDTLIM
jgi:hypothetical protein